MESTEKERVWHKGPPPHIGWWNASLHFDLNAWRWWDGENWSMSTSISLSAAEAGEVASNKAPVSGRFNGVTTGLRALVCPVLIRASEGGNQHHVLSCGFWSLVQLIARTIMSVSCWFRPGSRARILAGDIPAWIANRPRAAYMAAVCVAYPDWVERGDLNLLKGWARAMTIFTGELHVMDHIIPVNHPKVCGLGVPWNFQVIHWRANGSKGNTWEPDQLELFGESYE